MSNSQERNSIKSLKRDLPNFHKKKRKQKKQKSPSRRKEICKKNFKNMFQKFSRKGRLCSLRVFSKISKKFPFSVIIVLQCWTIRVIHGDWSYATGSKYLPNASKSSTRENRVHCAPIASQRRCNARRSGCDEYTRVSVCSWLVGAPARRRVNAITVSLVQGVTVPRLREHARLFSRLLALYTVSRDPVYRVRPKNAFNARTTDS